MMTNPRGTGGAENVGIGHEVIKNGTGVAIAARTAGRKGDFFFAQHPREGIGVLVAAVGSSVAEREERAGDNALARDVACGDAWRGCQPGFLLTKKRELAARTSAAKINLARKNVGVSPKIICMVPSMAASCVSRAEASSALLGATLADQHRGGVDAVCRLEQMPKARVIVGNEDARAIAAIAPARETNGVPDRAVVPPRLQVFDGR